MSREPVEVNRWVCELCSEVVIVAEEEGYPAGWGTVCERDVCADCIEELNKDAERGTKRPRNYHQLQESGRRMHSELDGLLAALAETECSDAVQQKAESLRDIVEEFLPGWDRRDDFECHHEATERAKGFASCVNCGAYRRGEGAWVLPRRLAGLIERRSWDHGAEEDAT